MVTKADRLDGDDGPVQDAEIICDLAGTSQYSELVKQESLWRDLWKMTGDTFGQMLGQTIGKHNDDDYINIYIISQTTKEIC